MKVLLFLEIIAYLVQTVNTAVYGLNVFRLNGLNYIIIFWFSWNEILKKYPVKACK